MSDHSRALVPISCWGYNSPELRDRGISVDIGLLAEALLYYDQVLLNIVNQPQFGELLNWFIQRDLYSQLLSLFRDETIKVYEYSFFTPVGTSTDGVYDLYNVQDPIQAQPDTFEQRYLYHKDVEKHLPKVRQRNALYSALKGNVIEAKAEDFVSAIDNAKEDWRNPARQTLILQAFIDNLYAMRGLGEPPQIEARVEMNSSGGKIHWNIDLDAIAKYAGKNLKFHKGVPLAAAAICNRTLWSAAQFHCDLYLGQPMSMLVGDKLFESSLLLCEPQKVITELNAKVEFPNIRELVNNGDISFSEVLTIRKKAKRFRNWLQTESERDRDAIIAYHHEVAKESGCRKVARKSLDMFGIIGGGALSGIIGASVGGVIGGSTGTILAGGAGAVASYLLQVATKMKKDEWKPVVFGNWMNDRIAKLLAKERKRRDR
jgi:hypothetical protein